VKPISPLEVFYKVKYESFHKITNDDEKCSICLEMIYEMCDKNTDYDSIIALDLSLDGKYPVCLLEKCTDHFFHTDCINNMIGSNNFIKCPICSKIYGKLMGTQPPGTMTASIMKDCCSGFSCDTICVTYSFPNGKDFSGTSRSAFLPNNADGIKILGLFKEAFDRKLMFTVGTSVTTGATNTTVWAGIHHKTALSGGSSSFGYPDKTYFTRVQEELAVKGVTEDSMDESPEKIAYRFLGSTGSNNDSHTTTKVIPPKVSKPVVNKPVVNKPIRKKK